MRLCKRNDSSQGTFALAYEYVSFAQFGLLEDFFMNLSIA